MATGKVLTTLDKFIQLKFQVEMGYQRMLLEAEDPSWETRWQEFEAALRIAGGVLDGSELWSPTAERSKSTIGSTRSFELRCWSMDF